MSKANGSSSKWKKVCCQSGEPEINNTDVKEHNGKWTAPADSLSKTFVDIKKAGKTVIKAEVTKVKSEGLEDLSWQDSSEEVMDEDNTDVEDPQSDRCLVCLKRFENKQCVQEHLQAAHNIVLEISNKSKSRELCICPTQDLYKLLYSCSVCSKVHRSEKNLRHHMTHEHRRELPTDCNICGRKYEHFKKLVAHKRVVHGSRSLWCDLCDYSTKHAMDLKRHVLRKHGKYEDYPYQCHVCRKRFVMPNAYKKHMITHETDRKMLECKYEGCDFQTISDSSMFLHIKKHKGENKVFECKICGVKLSTHQTYQIHMRRHLGDNPYECSTCGSRFPCLPQLSAHEKIHGEKKESCEVCGKKFLDKAKVKRHMLVHSEDKKWQCPWCPYKCNLDSNLRKHCHAKHNQLYPPKTRNQVSSTQPRHAAPLRYKRDMTAPPATPRSQGLPVEARHGVSSGAADHALQPTLYLDAASNTIILGTDENNSSLEAQHPKLSITEENGQYILLHVPEELDSHAAPSLLSDSATSTLQGAGDCAQGAGVPLEGALSSLPLITDLHFSKLHNQHPGEVQVPAASSLSTSVASSTVVPATQAHQITTAHNGSLLLMQPDGTTLELELAPDGQCLIKQHASQVENEDSTIRQPRGYLNSIVGAGESNDMLVTDPSQYIQSYNQSQAFVKEGGDNQLNTVQLLATPYSAFPSTTNQNALAPDDGKMAPVIQIEAGAEEIKTQDLENVTFVQNGNTINVVYGGQVTEQELLDTTGNVMETVAVINPEEFVNSV